MQTLHEQAACSVYDKRRKGQTEILGCLTVQGKLLVWHKARHNAQTNGSFNILAFDPERDIFCIFLKNAKYLNLS